MSLKRLFLRVSPVLYTSLSLCLSVLSCPRFKLGLSSVCRAGFSDMEVMDGYVLW